VRVGGFFLLAETDDPEDLQVHLRDALRSDNRVVDATIARAPDRSPTTARSVFPAARGDYTTELITGRDQRPSLQFFTPLELTIRVPIKNQPNHTPFDEIASEEYFAVWDGWVLAIGWEQDSDDVPPAGGQVIAQILEQAAEACDAGLYIQACSPWCEHLFNHVTLLVEGDPAATDSAVAPSTTLYQAVLTWPSPITSAAEATWAAYQEFSIPIQSFASMKNLGRRILDLERAARGELLGLMKLQYERAHASEHPLWERPVLLWQIRGWRKQSRASLARLWMTLTAIEELKREWSDTRVHFTDSLAGGGG
jgi:hypothetical protein